MEMRHAKNAHYMQEALDKANEKGKYLVLGTPLRDEVIKQLYEKKDQSSMAELALQLIAELHHSVNRLGRTIETYENTMEGYDILKPEERFTEQQSERPHLRPKEMDEDDMPW